MARRNITKLSEEYRAKYWNKGNSGAAMFYMHDYAQLFKAADNEIDRITMALEAGYMVGYKQAKKEARAKKKAQDAKAKTAAAAGSDQ